MRAGTMGVTSRGRGPQAERTPPWRAWRALAVAVAAACAPAIAVAQAPTGSVLTDFGWGYLLVAVSFVALVALVTWIGSMGRRTGPPFGR